MITENIFQAVKHSDARMIKYIKTAIVGITMLFGIGYFFQLIIPPMMPTILRVVHNKPVEFHGLNISYPKAMICLVEENSIIISYWNKGFPNLLISKVDDLDTRGEKEFKNFISKNSFKLLGSERLNFKGYNSELIYYVDNDWLFTRSLCIYDLNIIIQYSGKKKEFGEFEKIIDNIFCDTVPISSE